MPDANGFRMRYDLAIFDLDGTLADTFPFFMRTHDLVARRHGFATLGPGEVDTLRRFGPRELMRRIGLPMWRLPFVIGSFKRLMREQHEPIPLFDGVGDALARLEASGMRLAVVTTNSRENVDRLLGPGHCARLRHVECGASIFGKRRRLLRVLRASKVAPSRAIYIGDQIPDAEAARAAGIDFGAVSWGYATREALTAHPHAMVFDAPPDLLRLIAG